MKQGGIILLPRWSPYVSIFPHACSNFPALFCDKNKTILYTDPLAKEL